MTQPTHTLHHIQTHIITLTHTYTESHAHICTNKITYAQPSLYINTSENLNMHAHRLTCTHIYEQTQEHYVPQPATLFLAYAVNYAHIRKILTLTITPDFELTCIKKTITLTLTPTKNAQEIARIQKPISDSGFH